MGKNNFIISIIGVPYRKIEVREVSQFLPDSPTWDDTKVWSDDVNWNDGNN